MIIERILRAAVLPGVLAVYLSVEGAAAQSVKPSQNLRLQPAPRAPNAVELASDGQARLPIVVADQATAETKEAARTLADYLGRIAGAKFAVTTGDGQRGIVVGRAADFAAFRGQLPDAEKDITRREDYWLRSDANRLLALGATDAAVRHAVWDLLDCFGYRQFFPGEHWEIVPHVRQLRIQVDRREHPSYLARRIWYGFGPWDYAAKPYADWCAKNRATSGIELHTGHAYDGILRRNQAAFQTHPEYLGLVGGKRQSTKFCIANPGLRKLVVDDALRQFEKDPALDSVSVDPSDGGGWCECAPCTQLDSVTDRALTLANEVAAAVNARYPGKFVGMYAYNYHSPPPNLRAHPQVVISVATAFLKGGMTLDEMISGWSAKADRLGIREYYSVNVWDRDLPARARGGDRAYLQRTIPQFHERGARFLSAESSDNWGPNGLGYYLAARMLWDVGEARRVDELVEDFLARAFGPAREPMREFYRQLDGSQPHLVVADQLGRMFRSLDEARRLAQARDERARLDDLLQYARYTDLYQRYARSQGADRQQAFETLIRHAYRMRRTMLVHTKALYRDLPARDKSVAVPAEAGWQVPEGKNPWKSSVPFSRAELDGFLAEGIARCPLSTIDFTPARFSDELVAVQRLQPPDAPAGQLGAGRGKQTFCTRCDQAPATIEVQITGGLIAHYRDRGNVRVGLWKIGGASGTGERETLVAADRSTPPDGQEHSVRLTVKEPGLYKVVIEDGQDRTAVKWGSHLPCAVKSAADEPMNSAYGPWQMYFYVPRGTKVLGLFGGEHGEVCDSAGRSLFSLKGRDPNYYRVSVPNGEDGKFWSVRSGRGAIRLLTVPPYFALTPAALLLPKEVVEKDAK
jgi:hypothetical protein